MIFFLPDTSDDTWVVSLKQLLSWHTTSDHKQIGQLWNFDDFKTTARDIHNCTIKGLDENDEDLKGRDKIETSDLRLSAIFPTNRQLVWGQTIALIFIYIVCIIWSKYTDAHS